MRGGLIDSKAIRLELNKMIDESNQICRILDKDDVDVEFINKIGKKTYIKTPNSKQKYYLPNLIYHQGQIKENIIKKGIKKGKMSEKKKKRKIIEEYQINYFNILKGNDNKEIIESIIKSKNYGRNKIRKEEEKKVEKKLNKMVPEIMKRKRILTERLPLNIKKYRKEYEYVNNQIILDEINEKRYLKYDDPFLFPLDRFSTQNILPKYNNLFFPYKKHKIRDFFYRKTYTNFHPTNNKLNNHQNNNFKEIKLN